MKNILSILFLLVFTLHSDARMSPHLIGGSTPAAATYYCNSCPDSTNGADVLCEDCHLGDSDGVCDWGISEDGGATGDINIAATPDNDPALGCTDIGMTYALQVEKTNTTSATLVAYKAIAPGDNTYVQFYIKINNEGLGNSEDTNIIIVSTGADSISIKLWQTFDGNLRFKLSCYIDATGDNPASVSAYNLATDTWYGLRLYIYNPASAGSDSVSWWIDRSNNGTWTEEGGAGSLSLDAATDNVYVGIGWSQTKTIKYQISGLKIDDDAMPSSCAR